ncbi:hypothetical protein EV128_125122 [Rhizobium azibense]|nr:hypothetical protein EV128_125122 [Rhizobium azibense]
MQKPHFAKATSHPVTIHIAGDPIAARRICQEFCDAAGLCVTVIDADYIYTGGNEVGVRVGLINYPRFPKERWEIDSLAFALASKLREELSQESFTIETPLETKWFSWRKQDLAK